MELTDGNVFHIYNRGNQQQKIFFSDANYLFFLRKMTTGLLPYCDLLAYCLMPNHFHLLVRIKPSIEGGCENANQFSDSLAVLLRSYTRAMQRQESFTGSLFQQNTKSKILNDENDVLTCFNYIHQNPVKANLAKKPSGWKYSSAFAYKNTFSESMCNHQLLFELAVIKENYDFDNDFMFTEEKIKRITA